MKTILRWLIMAVSILVAAYIIPGSLFPVFQFPPLEMPRSSVRLGYNVE